MYLEIILPRQIMLRCLGMDGGKHVTATTVWVMNDLSIDADESVGMSAVK